MMTNITLTKLPLVATTEKECDSAMALSRTDVRITSNNNNYLSLSKIFAFVSIIKTI